jgi:hypothetical protein
MGTGLGKMFITASFHARFNELLFVSIALALLESRVIGLQRRG